MGAQGWASLARQAFAYLGQAAEDLDFAMMGSAHWPTCFSPAFSEARPMRMRVSSPIDGTYECWFRYIFSIRATISHDEKIYRLLVVIYSYTIPESTQLLHFISYSSLSGLSRIRDSRPGDTWAMRMTSLSSFLNSLLELLKWLTTVANEFPNFS